MKRARWYLVAGALAGFGGVWGLHGTAGPPPTALGQPKSAPGAGKGHSTPPAGGTGGQAVTGPAARAGPVRVAVGAVEQYGYGELSVKVTVTGNEITGVSVPLLRTAEPYSQQLAAQVLPMLRAEVLAAHSARINGISGATYTAAAYATSVQSALDKLHVK